MEISVTNFFIDKGLFGSCSSQSNSFKKSNVSVSFYLIGFKSVTSLIADLKAFRSKDVKRKSM